MKKVELTFPELGMIAATRLICGAGAGLLLSEKLNPDERKAVGWTLFLIGALSTIPLAANVFMKNRRP
jgi:hypothetical protein